MLLFVDKKDGGAIFFSGIRPLCIDFGRIMRPPEQSEQLRVAGFSRIKRDLNGLGFLHVARDYRAHARRLLKNCLRAPKTTACEISYVCLRTLRLRTKHYSQEQEQRQKSKERLGFVFDRRRTTNLPHTTSTLRYRLM